MCNQVLLLLVDSEAFWKNKKRAQHYYEEGQWVGQDEASDERQLNGEGQISHYNNSEAP